MCHGYMALSMLKTRKICNNLGVFYWYDVVSVLICRKTGFKGKMTKRGRIKPKDDVSDEERMNLHDGVTHGITHEP